MDIRPEQAEDAEAIDKVVRDAFLGAAHASGTEHLIVRELRQAGALTLSLVAVVDGAVVAHAAVSPVTISDGTPGWFGLGPVAVTHVLQRCGFGSALVRAALQQLQAQGAAGCVVLGEPAYYGRFGFAADPALVLEGVPAGYFQALRFAGASPRGTVRYHPGFAAGQAATTAAGS